MVTGDNNAWLGLNNTPKELTLDGTILQGNIMTGNTVLFDNREWIVCQTDYTKKSAYLISYISVQRTEFGPDIYYANSKLRQVAKAFENQMSPGALARMKNVTVNGVTSKVFVASSSQLSGEFNYFITDGRRACVGIDNEGSHTAEYWTSSHDYDNEGVHYIHNTGQIPIYSKSPNDVCWFRPCICISL